MRNGPDEDIFEEFLRQAVVQYGFNELERYPSDEEMDKLSISDACDDKIRKMIKRFQRLQSLNKGLKIMKKTAAMITVAAGISFIFLFQFEEVRAACYNVWIQVTSRYVQYDYAASDEGVGEIELGYVPDGFHIVQEMKNEHSYFVLYENDRGGEFHFDYNQSGTLHLDNEHYDISDITVNGSSGQYYSSTDERFTDMLIWYNGYGSFLLNSTLGKDEILKIAENIEY